MEKVNQSKVRNSQSEYFGALILAALIVFQWRKVSVAKSLANAYGVTARESKGMVFSIFPGLSTNCVAFYSFVF
jgi:hypothetical protein